MELIYHYLWKNRLFGLSPALDSGEKVDVLDPGLSNPNAGPDFFNSKIRIGGTEWVGNVEIHTRASDWHRHSHHLDPNYDSVILHVVGDSDREIRRTDGSLIPQMALPLPKDFCLTYSELKSDLKSVRCASRIGELSRLVISDCLDSMGTERLQTKAIRILDLLDRSGGDWNTAAFVTLARALGFGLNSEPFEILARSLPLNYLLRHSDDRFQLEALLFGQAGLLPEPENSDAYAERLRTEYRFLSRKYNLSPIPAGLWRFARTRPQNFPHRRIAFLAAALEASFPLPGMLRRSADSVDEIRRYLGSLSLSGYWGDHYVFGVSAPEKQLSLSRSSINLMVINLAAPYLYALASRRSDPELGEKAFELLTALPAESNSIIKTWKAVGISPASALESQALIQLRREYCDRACCLRCRFGASLLRRKIREPKPTAALV